MKIRFLTTIACALALCVFASAQEIAERPASTAENNSRLSRPAETSAAPDADQSAAINQSMPATTSQTQTASGSAYVRPSADKRFKRYINGVVGPAALARTTASAGYSTWRNSPEEWGKNWEGFGRRFASGLGRNAIRGTIVYTLDETLKLDSAFYRSTKKGFGNRFGDALLSTVTARRPNGKRVLGVPRLAGAYAAGIISYEAWYPRRFGYKDGIRSATVSLGFNAAFNLFREFIWKK